jgi:hypothetical protein
MGHIVPWLRLLLALGASTLFGATWWFAEFAAREEAVRKAQQTAALFRCDLRPTEISAQVETAHAALGLSWADAGEAVSETVRHCRRPD